MVIARLLGSMSAATFLERHFGKLTFACPGRGEPIVEFAGWTAIDSMLAQAGVDAFLCRGGSTWESGALPTAQQAHALVEQGYTLSIRRAHAHDTALGRLAESFR